MSRVMIMAGGTGGHVFPGLAVAEVLRQQGVTVSWMGTRRGLEARVIPSANIDIDWITMQGLRRRGWLGWLLLPLRMLAAMGQAWRILRKRQPDAVLAMGGFVSAPGALMAWMMRKPLLIHEQNAVPGLANRLLSMVADQVLCGFPGTFGGLPGARHVGNPVRPEIAGLDAPELRLPGHSGRLRVLIVGGSQGAKVFNERVPQACGTLPPERRPLIRHQSGSRWLEQTRRAYEQAGVEAEVVPFIEDMAEAYAWADLAICRSGAMTVAELAAAGVAAILVPYPFAVDDHQTANARYLSERDAAILLSETELTTVRLAELLEEFSLNRQVLGQMSVHARGSAVTDAAETVAALCREASHA